MDQIKITKKTGQEKFSFNKKDIETELIDFWRWSGSDLISNSYRGILAEYLVGLDLGVTNENRMEWAPFDLHFNGLAIEIKSSAYIQSWSQKQFSKIIFNISPTYPWDYKTNSYSKYKTRPSHFYVFCLLNHKTHKTINPMNLDQWDFYIIPTYWLTNLVGNQKTITLNRLKKLGVYHSKFGGIKLVINKLLNKDSLGILSNFNKQIN